MKQTPERPNPVLSFDSNHLSTSTSSCNDSSFTMSSCSRRLSTTKADACILRDSLRGSARNLGRNYALAWKTGGGTHMTLAYLTNVKRGYEQHRVKRLVEEFLQENGIPAQLPLTVGNMETERCVSVASGDIVALQWAIHSFLEEKGFNVKPLRSPHIDLRGQSSAILDDWVCTRNWNW